MPGIHQDESRKNIRLVAWSNERDVVVWKESDWSLAAGHSLAPDQKENNEINSLYIAHSCRETYLGSTEKLIEPVVGFRSTSNPSEESGSWELNGLRIFV